MLKTILVAFAIPVILTATAGSASAVTAIPASPEPIAYDYPSCYQDPDVSCITRPGDPESQPSYASGQYPEGWATEHYRQKGQYVYGQPLATGRPVSVTPVAAEPVRPAQPSEPPADDAVMVAGTSTQTEIAESDWLYDALYDLLYKE